MGQATGIIIVIISLFGVGLSSFLFFKKGNVRAALILLVLSGFTLRAFVASDQFLHKWDERYHALVAKNMMEDPFRPTLYKHPLLPYDYKNWTANHIWVHKPPLTLWLITLSFKVFGAEDFSVRIPSLILSSLLIWLTYEIGKRLYDKKVGFIASLLMCINGLVIELTSGRIATDHVDITFLFFITLSILLAIIHAQTNHTLYFLAFSVTTGCAILSKWLPGLISLPVWIMFCWHFQGRISKALISKILFSVVIIGLVVLPWYLYIFSAFPKEASWENLSIFKHVTEVLEEQTGPFYYYFDRLRINYGELVYLPFLWFFIRVFKSRSKIDIAILLWFIVPYLFFSFVLTKMQGYTVFTSPAIFIVTASFFWWILKQAKGRMKFLYIVVASLLLILPIRYCIERVKPTQDFSKQETWANELRYLNKRFSAEKIVFFNVKSPVELMFYSEFPAYEKLPSLEEIQDLESRGWAIVLNNAPESFKDRKEIQRISLIEPNN